MKVCVIDNPCSMAREAWQDGMLVRKINAEVLLGENFDGGKWFDFRLNCGEWKTGKLHYGDRDAMRI